VIMDGSPSRAAREGDPSMITAHAVGEGVGAGAGTVAERLAAVGGG
jgi:hypothetical protein